MTEHGPRPGNALTNFLASGSAGGVALVIATLLALFASNSSWSDAYAAFQETNATVAIGRWLDLEKPLVIWINDLWMAVFFLLVGLEIKREWLAGELSSRSQALLPAVAALGGMAVPALIYAALNHDDAQALRGWAIPSATDIAFALAIVLLLGKRVPTSLRVFLTAVAIIDDLGAILLIAVFYTHGVSMPMLGAAGIGPWCSSPEPRAGRARGRVRRRRPGDLVCVLKSGCTRRWPA
jgi:NhaA family Na+:H+ antiporter